MSWNIDEAERHFSEIITAVSQTPQLIYRHNHLIAAVIRADLFQEFLQWQTKQPAQAKQQPPSLAHAFAELRQLCAEENYSFEIPTRQNRPNPFADILT